MARSPVVAVAALAAVLAAAASVAAAPGQQRCLPTPNDGSGPFGRNSPPLRAKIGTGHVLTGVVLDVGCKPLAGAYVQFWQANKVGRYTPAGSATVMTDRNGRFRLEGPRPVSYAGRPAHIHILVGHKDHELLYTRYEPHGKTRGTIRLVLTPTDL